MDSPWPPPRPGATRPTILSARTGDGAILGGVARDLGARTGVDPLWYRIAFVVLTTFGGLGALLYCGAWLILRGRERSAAGPLVILGIAVVTISLLVLFGGPGTNIFESPWTLVFVLAGIAVALWQPRTVTPQVPRVEDVEDRAVGGWAPPPPAGTPVARRARQPSVLGRWTLALALLVGAAGALGYHLGGGGLHPERWLGAATVVCGVGVFVGSWRGRALWLVVPALLFAGSGVVAGHAARAGIDEIDAGSHSFAIGDPAGPALPTRKDVVAGTIAVTMYAAPPEGIRSDLRVGLGEIEIVVDDDVTVEVRARVHDGDVVVDGVERRHDGELLVLRLGPGATPDAVIDATVSTGRVEVAQHQLGREISRGERLEEG